MTYTPPGSPPPDGIISQGQMVDEKSRLKSGRRSGNNVKMDDTSNRLAWGTEYRVWIAETRMVRRLTGYRTCEQTR